MLAKCFSQLLDNTSQAFEIEYGLSCFKPLPSKASSNLSSCSKHWALLSLTLRYSGLRSKARERKAKNCQDLVAWKLSRQLHLSNRKHVPCFYRVIQTRVEVWENEKCCGNTSRRRVFLQLFRVLPNFHECLYNSIETLSPCFLFLLENTATRKRKTTCQKFDYHNVNSLCSRHHYVNSARFPSSYTNTIFNQSARVLSYDCFLNWHV